MQLTRLGPYELGRVVGKGGMGSVYEAVDSQTGQRVAIKALSPHLAQTEGFRERFEAEIDSLKTLRHDGIVRLYGYGAQEGMLFYSMELVDGTSLEEELRGRRRFSWREVAQITIQLCRALKHAHDHGVVHRDIKPANILLDADNRVKLADFGIARLFGSNQLTSAGGVLGTADYMSPEQAEGRPVTDRCDQYSLGGVMYALLAGRPPFRAKNLPEMLQLQRFAEPEPVRRYARDVPEQMEYVIKQLLSKDPQDRFPNTLVLARHLEAMVRALSRPSADNYSLDEGATPARPPVADLSESLAVTRSEYEADERDGGGTLQPGEPATELMVGRNADVEPSPLVGEIAPDAVTPPAPAEPAPEIPNKQSRPRESTFTSIDEEARRKQAAEGANWRSAVLQGAGMIGLLAVLVASAVYLGRPDDADSLYETIRAAAMTTDDNGLREVDREITEFLRRFPNDERVQQVEQLRQQLELNQFGRQLQLRVRMSGRPAEPLLPIEQLYLRAEELAKRDPAAGREMFDSIIALYGEEPPGDLDPQDAARRQACLKLAQKRVADLQLAVDELAARERPRLLERLESADRLAAEQPEAARRIYRAVIDLYGNQDWAADIVRKARAGRDQLPP